MATETSRTFDLAHGRIVVTVKDAVLGNETVHSIYVTGAQGVTDVDAAVEQVKTEADAAATTLHAAFMAAGWQPNGS
jgi:hypothetical protein